MADKNLQEFNAFWTKYGVDKLKTLNSDGKEVPISALESNALECIVKTGMLNEKKCELEDKMHAMYFAIHHFMETGNHLDAFDIYTVYSGAFLNDSGDQLQNMMNFVASYENGAARLVQSHRDHYVHSAYVFILGLALFNTQEAYRESFCKSYKIGDKNNKENYSKFVKLWGLTALFHDIGYQYEIPFIQIRENNEFEFFEDIENIKDSSTKMRYVYFHYENMDKFTNLINLFYVHGKYVKNKKLYNAYDIKNVYLKALVGDTFVPKDIEDVLAYHIRRKLKTREYLKDIDIANELRLKNKPQEIPPDEEKKENEYKVFMDHAYFSGVRLFKQMIEIYGLKFCTNSNQLSEFMDAITAITMHNKFFEKVLSKKNNMKMDEHPLAYLLILCDELQCWDRTSFGKSSLKQFYALDCEFEFNDGYVKAKYCFDEKKDAIQFKNDKINDVIPGPLKEFLLGQDKQFIDEKYPEVTKKWDKNDCTTWHISSTDYKKGDDTRFLYSIHEIVDCSGSEENGVKNGILVGVEASFKKTGSKYCREYLTTISMEDVYNLASEFYKKYTKGKAFDDSSRIIQDKLHDVMMVKAIGEILNSAHCFALKEQKAFERIMQWDDFTDIEKTAMTDIMIKRQETYLEENYIAFKLRGIDIDSFLADIKGKSEELLKYVIEALLAYPGMEVYRM